MRKCRAGSLTRVDEGRCGRRRPGCAVAFAFTVLCKWPLPFVAAFLPLPGGPLLIMARIVRGGAFTNRPLTPRTDGVPLEPYALGLIPFVH